MFFTPFIKYFRPHFARTTLAIVCMFVVGILSVGPILLIREVIDLLSVANVQQLDVAVVTSRLPSQHKDKEVGTASYRTDWLKSNILNRLGNNTIYARCSGWWNDSLTWYHQKSVTNPLMTLLIVVVALITTIFLKGIAEFITQFNLTYILTISNIRLCEDIFRNVLSQDYLYFNRNSVGYLLSRITSDIRAIGDIFSGLLLDGIQQPINIFFYLIILLVISPRLTLIALPIIPVAGALFYYIAHALRKNTIKQKKMGDRLSSGMTESLRNIRLIKAFGTENLENEKFHLQSMDMFRQLMARRLAKFGGPPTIEWLGSMVMGGIILFGWLAIHHGGMNLGDFVAYLVTLNGLYRPTRGLVGLIGKYQNARVSSERILEMLALRPDIKEREDALPFQTIRDGIEIRNLGFRYGEKQILSHITVQARPGQCIAFVGPSGSGKTTLINMLARLFDPTEGAILIDGIDLREYRLKDWRARLGIVTQDTYLFDTTVAGNITYGTAEMDEERMVAAARAAYAHEFINGLEGGLGYQTPIGPGGVRLSGGQQQRIAIARALYRDPQVLILDEATSALDEPSQALVKEALAKLMAGRTTFIVSHRLSTVQHADQLYVLGGGRILESGTHAQLTANHGGAYSTLINASGAEDDFSAVPWPEENPMFVNPDIQGLPVRAGRAAKAPSE